MTRLYRITVIDLRLTSLTPPGGSDTGLKLNTEAEREKKNFNYRLHGCTKHVIHTTVSRPVSIGIK